MSHGHRYKLGNGKRREQDVQHTYGTHWFTARKRVIKAPKKDQGRTGKWYRIHGVDIVYKLEWHFEH